MLIRKAATMTDSAVKRTRGITLVELLVGLGIITIVFLALGYIFQQAVQANNIATGQAEIHQQARAVFEFLGRELRGIPRRNGRLVLTSPNGALTRWNVNVQGDVVAFTTATPLPLRKSDEDTDPYINANFGAVCYFRWMPSLSANREHQVLYRVVDRMDSGQSLSTLSLSPIEDPAEEDQLALRVVTPLAAEDGGSQIEGAFEVAFYDDATGAFVPLADGGREVYDSETDGLPRAIRVRLRCWDRRKHVRDEVRKERGIEFQETYWLPAAE